MLKENTLIAHKDFFAHYSEDFCHKIADASMLRLKIHHTERVLHYVELLVQEEACLKEHSKACTLAALYHDIGRFEQFLQYNTFRDTQSVNHALHGAKVLKKTGILQCESKEVQKHVLAAVAMHNRFALPHGLDRALKNITYAVRDADKLDILRVMSEQFSPVQKGEEKKHEAVTFYAKNEPSLWSPAMLEDIMQNRLASYANIVYINDFKLLLGSWVHDMNFASSKKYMLNDGYLHKILASLPDVAPMHRAKAHILAQLHEIQGSSCASL